MTFMKEFDASKFDAISRLGEVAPGSLKAYKGSGRRVIVATVEEGSGELLEDGLPAPDIYHVCYVVLGEDEDSPDGCAVEVRLEKEYFDPFDAGMEFREFSKLLTGNCEDEGAGGSREIYPPGDPLEERAWAKEVFDSAYDIAERDVMRRLRAEAALLKGGRTAYPPQESVLGEILKEIGALPEPPGERSPGTES